MSRIVYLNGKFLPESDARISIFDRGFLFADSVYEVCFVLAGTLIDNTAHLARLHRSLAALDIPAPITDEKIVNIQNELIEKNQLDEGLVYLQVTRGTAPRDFLFPENTSPSLVMFTQTKSIVNSPLGIRGISVISIPDIRWQRRDIKTTGLLAQSMGKTQAAKAGADDAWMVEDNLVTEGTSNNAYIVTNDDVLITRSLSARILAGVTRAAILTLAGKKNIRLDERPFSLSEAYSAREAFITSATALLTPVVKIDDHIIGDGRPGPISQALRQHYIDAARAQVTST